MFFAFVLRPKRAEKEGDLTRMIAAKLRLTMATMGKLETKVRDLCQKSGTNRQTLYRHISLQGELRPDRMKLLSLNSAV